MTNFAHEETQTSTPNPDASGPEYNTGLLVSFMAFRRFGFIRPDHGGEDIFVHAHDLIASKITHIARGQAVSFSITRSTGQRSGVVATNIVLLSEQHKSPAPSVGGEWESATIRLIHGHKGYAELRGDSHTPIMLHANVVHDSRIVDVKKGMTVEVITAPNFGYFPFNALALRLPENPGATESAPKRRNDAILTTQALRPPAPNA